MRDLPAVNPQTALGWNPMFWAGALGIGAYYFLRHAKAFKEETKNMKELEFRNVALAMVSQATKMIEHLTSTEATLRDRVATLEADLSRMRHDWEKLVHERAENNGFKQEAEELRRANENLKKLCDMRTEQVTNLQEKLNEAKSREVVGDAARKRMRSKRRRK
jgi:predicted RNase H-like nuclease (RuvC/YqgF family)